MSDEKNPLVLRSSQNGEAVTGNFWHEVGGRPTFEKLVREFYAGVASDEVLRPMYPEDDLEGCHPAADRLPGAVLGRSGHLQRAARASAAADAAPAVQGEPCGARPLAAAHACRRRLTRAAAAPG